MSKVVGVCECACVCDIIGVVFLHIEWGFHVPGFATKSATRSWVSSLAPSDDVIVGAIQSPHGPMLKYLITQFQLWSSLQDMQVRVHTYSVAPYQVGYGSRTGASVRCWLMHQNFAARQSLSIVPSRQHFHSRLLSGAHKNTHTHILSFKLLSAQNLHCDRDFKCGGTQQHETYWEVSGKS